MFVCLCLCLLSDKILGLLVRLATSFIGGGLVDNHWLCVATPGFKTIRYFLFVHHLHISDPGDIFLLKDPRGRWVHLLEPMLPKKSSIVVSPSFFLSLVQSGHLSLFFTFG